MRPEYLIPKGPLGFMVPAIRNLSTGIGTGIENFYTGSNLTPEQINMIGGGGLLPNITMVPGGTGMIPLKPSPAATKQFVNSPLMNKAMGVQNVGNLPAGEALRLATNSLVPPETPSPSRITAPSVNIPRPAVAKSAADLARADATKEWEDHRAAVAAGKKPADSGFALSPLFFAEHPDVSGGVFVGPQGPKFLFNDTRPQAGGIMPVVNDLIKQFTDRIASGNTLSASGHQLGPGYFVDAITKLLAPAASMTNAQTGANLAPSQIAQNLAAATKPQVGLFPTGPEGQQGGFLIPPGGQPQQFTAGTPATPERNTITGLINQGYIEYMKEASKIDADVFQLPEQKTASHAALQNRFQTYFNGLQQMGGSRGGGSATGTTGKPSLQTWLPQAQKANPGKTPEELTAYFNQKYGR